MRIAIALISLFAGLSTGCLKRSAFTCANDEACGAGGTCELETGFCSVSDQSCTSGRRYSDTAGGGFESQCVGGGTPADGPDDGSVADTPTDGPVPTGCNADFATITNGNPNHKYKFFSAQAIWLTQQNTLCGMNSSYMAIPDDALELAALFALASNTKIWIGVSDRVMENQFRDTKNQPYNALPLTGNNGNKDCATTNNGTPPLPIEDCDNQSLPVVCECEE